MNEISSRDVMERLFRRWYLVALGVVVGGMAAWSLAFLLPPVYEAHADVYLNLDSLLWAQENHLGDPTELAVANSVLPVSNLFYAPQTLSALAAAAADQGLPFDPDRLLDDFSIQRINMNWEMTVRAADPQSAARLADLWVQVALPVYTQAHAHALSAYALTLERDALAACFEGASVAAGNTCAGTAFAALADLSPALGDLDARIISERELSMGLDPALTLEAGQPAAIPGSPVRFARTWLTLAGAGIGLILSLAAGLGILPLRRKNTRA